MSSRLDDLMRLARKTGDTLIIHDEKKGDMVIMDVLNYEILYDMSHMDDDMHFCDHEHELHDMSEGELIDKINRDIAIWRSHRETDEMYNQECNLEEQLKENPLSDPFEEDYIYGEDWHRAGTVLEDRHPEFLEDEDGDEGDDEFEDTGFLSDNGLFDWNDDEEDLSSEVLTQKDEIDLDDIPDFGSLDDDKMSIGNTPLLFAQDSEASNNDFMYDPLGQDEVFSEKRNDKQDVPFVFHDEEFDFKEEPIDDNEPVFFEEPV